MGAVRPVKFIISGIDKFSRQFKKANKSLSSLSSKVRPVGQALTLGLTLPVVAFGVKTLQVAGNFESTMNAVQVAVTATSSQLKKLSLDAREIGKTTQFSASQAANAFEQLGFAGVGVGKVVEATGIVMDFAAASGKELGVASTDLLDISKALEKPLSELGELSDALGAGFSASTSTLGQLVEGFREGAPVAAGLNISLAELTAGIATFGAVGFKGSRGGTKFRNFLSRLVEPVPRARVELKKLGIARADLFDKFGKLKSFQNTIKIFKDTTITARQLKIIFGEESFAAISALIRANGTFNEILGKVNDGMKKGGITAEIAKARQKGFEGSIKRLNSAFEELLLTIGLEGGFLGLGTKMAKVLAKITNKISGVSPFVIKFVGALAILAALIGPILLLFTALSVAFTVVGVIIGGPVLATIAALAVAASLLFAFWKPIKSFFIGLWQGITFVFSKAVDKIKEVLLRFKNIFIVIGAVIFGPLLLGLGPFLLFAALIIKFWTPIKGFMKKLAKGIVAVWEPIKTFFKELWEDLLGLFKEGISKLFKQFDLIENFFKRIVGGVPEKLLSFFGIGGAGALPSGAGEAGGATIINKTEMEAKITIEGPPGTKTDIIKSNPLVDISTGISMAGAT